MMKFEKLKNDISLEYKKLGLKKNDTIYLSVNVGELFKNYLSQELLKKYNIREIKKKVSNILLNELKKIIGTKGTIIVPTFSFNFIKKKIFNPNLTKSDLGYFSNFFLKDKTTIRSLHPTNSVSSWGKYSNYICKNNGKFPFGINSPYGKMQNLNLKFVNLGCRFYTTSTYVHHLEHLNGFHIRYNKLVKGKIFSSGRYLQDYYFINVRFLKIQKEEPINFYKILKNKRKVKEIKNNFFSSVIDIKDLNKIGIEILKSNPFIFENKTILINYNENISLKTKRTRYHNK